MGIVQIGDEGEAIGRLPGDGRVIEESERGTGTTAAKLRRVRPADAERVQLLRVFGTDVRGRENRQTAIEQIEANAAFERRSGVVVEAT